MERKPDLLVSGINHGGNMAICVNYSGTMGATAEGCIFNVPSMGVSLLDHAADADFSECCRLGRMLARRVLKEGLPHGTYLNLNVPKLPQVKGLKVCRQADGRWVREFKRSENASGEPVFWLTGAFESAKPIHPDNDMLALDSGYASLVPCKIDVTDYDMKYYLLAGEASGDLHASNLMAALKENDPKAEFRFLGGELMRAVGGTLV